MSSNGVLDRWHLGCTVPGTWNAGVDGDREHAGHGYHIFRLLLVWLDYSSGRGLNSSTRDFGGRDNCSAAVDRGGPPAQVVVMTRRLLAAIATPEGRYMLRGVREFNGSADGRTTLNRDAVLGWAQNYLPDPSHLMHIHVTWFRDVCEDVQAVADCLAVVNGTWQPGQLGTTAAGPPEALRPVSRSYLEEAMPTVVVPPSQTVTVPVPEVCKGGEFWLSWNDIHGVVGSVGVRVAVQVGVGSGMKFVPLPGQRALDIQVETGGKAYGVQPGARCFVVTNSSAFSVTATVAPVPPK